MSFVLKIFFNLEWYHTVHSNSCQNTSLYCIRGRCEPNSFVSLLIEHTGNRHRAGLSAKVVSEKKRLHCLGVFHSLRSLATVCKPYLTNCATA